MRQKHTRTDLEPAAFYLRKSREDAEAEARGEGETLAKHKRDLFRLAKDYNVNITHVFEEVVSGESIIYRPEMMQLLKEIAEGKWRSIFCIEVDRLGRGDMEDQGLILKTFKNSNTLIVTPRKIYDLNNEFDEEYTEFEAFMARKELKIITRRLQGGRLRSIEDGNYLGTFPPYGYQIEKTDHRRYLVKNPNQSDATELIWNLYRTSNMGTNKIANELNRIGYPSYTGKKWSASSVLVILKNPAYAGFTVWKKKEQKKSAIPGKKRDTRMRPISEQIWIADTHEPYVTKEIFTEVQGLLLKKYHPPYQLTNGITNPLAGLIKCDICGKSMVYRPYHNQPAHLVCHNRQCNNKSTRFDYVEKRLIACLEDWLTQYHEQFAAYQPKSKKTSSIALREKALSHLIKESKELYKQKDKLHELLEKEIYDETTYVDRSKKLSTQIAENEQSIKEMSEDLKKEILREKSKKEYIPKIEKMLKAYKKEKSPGKKNRLLKTILDYATYRKEQNQKIDEFTLILHPLLPK